MLSGVIPERTVRFRLRTVLSLLAIIIGVAVTLEVIWIARHVLTWVVISVFLALALNPLVGWLQRRGLKRRGAAAAVAFFAASACSFLLSFNPERQPCGKGGTCLSGYVCNAKNLCVRAGGEG